MRLLVVSNAYWPNFNGGFEILCEEHVGWLVGRGHEVVVLTVKSSVDGPAPGVGRHGERVVRGLEFRWADYQHRHPGPLTSVRQELEQRRLVEGLLAKWTPDVAALWGMAGVGKSLIAEVQERGVPMVAVIGEPWPVWDLASDPWLRKWVDGGTPRIIRKVLAPVGRRVAPIQLATALSAVTPLYVSEDVRVMSEAGVPAWSGRGTLVPNGIRGEAFPAVPREALPAVPRLLYAGRVEQRKGLHTVIEALDQLRREGVETALTIAGWEHATYAADIRAAVARAGLDDAVTWRGPVTRAALAMLYGAHDVLLFPTIWREPFGLVPLEAMATGCAVLATGTGGSADYLRDEQNCLLFPAESATGLAGALTRLRDEPALLARLREGGRATAAAHDFEHYAETVEHHLLVAGGLAA
ncbi:MAG: glycosyltransferase family 4 protein [Candidatus Dormibacteria bacterium]